MRLETSFKNEANNARKCAELLDQTPELRDKVYIPRVYGQDEGCAESDRIMVMEWVDGVRYVSQLRSPVLPHITLFKMIKTIRGVCDTHLPIAKLTIA